MSIKMHFPQSTNEYALPEYWEQRFERETHYEWFGDYHAFRDLVRPDLKPSSRILILGNGTSRLPFDLVNDGFHNITATDICPNLIQRLNQTYLIRIAFFSTECSEKGKPLFLKLQMPWICLTKMNLTTLCWKRERLIPFLQNRRVPGIHHFPFFIEWTSLVTNCGEY